MNSTAVKDFFDWYKSWYKPITGEINIMFSVPNELHLQEFRMLMVEENVVVLELFEKIDQGINAKVYMRQICDKADELGVTIYLEPMPRYKYFRKNIEKRKKVSKEYLFAYYAGFGFEPTSDNRFMKRTPKMNMDIDNMIDAGIVQLEMYDTTPQHAAEYGLTAVRPLYLKNLCVDKEYRLKKVGKSVLEYIEDYARRNGHDIIFGHVARKADFTKDERQTTFCDVEMIKYWLHDNGYAINDDNNDFHKVVKQFGDGGEFDDEGGQMEKENKLDIVRQKFLEPISLHAYTSGYGNVRGVKVRIKDHLANWDNFYLYDLPNLREGESPYLLSVVINNDFDKNTVSAYYGKSASNIEDFEIEFENEFPDLKAVELVFGKDDRVEDIIGQIEFEIEYMTKGKRFAGGGRFHLGGDMSVHLAPNGKPSNLTHEQWHLVRTPEFKNWFGDWEEAYRTGNYEGVSKVVDSNGEPLVVFRGSKSKNPNYIPHKHELSNGIYFSTKKDVAELYTKSFWQNWVGRIFECFLNIRNLEYYDTLKLKSNIYQADFEFYNKLVIESKKNNFDGICWDNFIDVPDLQVIFPKEPEDYMAKTFIVFEPNQIKLADGSNTTFDGSNPDIRYAKGGVFPSLITSYSQLGW